MLGERWIRAGCLAASAALVAVGLTSCSSGTTPSLAVVGDEPWDMVVERANDEGSLNFYSTAPELQNERLVDAFNEEYPDIRILVTRGAGELPPRVSAEIQSGSIGGDVFLYSDPAWFSKHADYLLPPAGPATPSWPDAGWQVRDKAIIPSAYPFGMIVWNTDIFPNGFRTWDDLLDPSVQGTLGTRSDVTPAVAGYLDFLERTLGEDYLIGLGQQNPKFYPSVVPMTQAVASGEIGVANTSTPSVVKDLQEVGAPIDAVVPDPSYAIQWGAAAIATSRHPNAARVFMDFMMSEEGQHAINGDGLGVSALSGVEGALSVDGLTMLDSQIYTKEVIAQWNRKVAQYFP